MACEPTANTSWGTQVMTINTTARMATADYGNQKYQALNFQNQFDLKQSN
jgi:hypothetical protein